MAIGLGLLGGGKVVDRTGVGTHALVVGDGFGGATAGLAGADGSLDAVLGGGVFWMLCKRLVACISLFVPPVQFVSPSKPVWTA